MKTDQELKNLIKQGYKQTSRAYGTITRLPSEVDEDDALSMFDYLLKVDKNQLTHMLKFHMDQIRRDQNNSDLQIVLSQVELNRFRQLGGEAAR